ncbi:hypothetical protein HELRODRAFT_109184 [Helobdella robusta]|uniref:Cytochrome P450 n=1 Tax=Helobdella robusta TaxID=6412 RepID=T1EER1_HELRO|nr:hypothetical protein HELRODRAFT_109184 [Helobdella robusta]ESO10866.1 hypothetical protein HELRODRAFT_109184 [Helobdella robusta]
MTASADAPPSSSFSTTNVLLLGSVFALSYYFIFKRKKLPPPIIVGDDTEYKHPPCLPTVPFLGSLPFLPAFPWHYKYFTKNMTKYGDVLAYYVLDKYHVVLNSKEAVFEAFVKRSTDFADRPKAKINEVLNPQNKGIVFHKYDEAYKRYHKLSLGIMKQFGFGNRVMEKRIMEEMKYFMESLASYKGCEFHPTPDTTKCTMNILCGILFGKRFDDDDPDLADIISNIRTTFDNFGKVVVGSILPFLKLVLLFIICFKQLIASYLNGYHVPAYMMRCLRTSKGQPPTSFIRSYVELEGPNYDKTQFIHFMHELFLVGTETSASTVEWCMVLLANHPDVQEKMYKELERVLRNSVNYKSILPSLEDKKNLIYCDAVFNEIIRYKSVGPMTLPHQCMRDSHVMGFFIPAGTTVFGNLHGAHYDPRVWDKPDVFHPERFLHNGSIVNKEHLVPFSLGKRSCFGEILARQEVFLSLTNLVWRFKILPPIGQREVKVDDVMDITAKPSSFNIRLVERK